MSEVPVVIFYCYKADGRVWQL